MGLAAFLPTCFGDISGISFVDSTSLDVCDPKRVHHHKTFEEQAQWGKSSTGWFFGFKLHLIVNDRGELLSVALTAANVDDRRPVSQMTEKLWGKLFGY
jgi:IS5 family transposase